ncbi:MAG: hypothetical protein JXM68_00635 [Sedimentisphaerales bacterium]|nr:hypothetical protein [Sedimentisphaerales bacterium]
MLNAGNNKRDIWQKLVKISRFHAIIMGNPVIRMDHHSITIVPGSGIRLYGFALFIAGVIPFFVEWALFGWFQYNYNCINLFTGSFGLAGLFAGLYLMLRRDSITWPGFGHGVYIRQGFIFYSMVYFLPLENMQASLVLNKRSGFARKLNFANDCMLILSNPEKEGVIMVAGAQERQCLLGALNCLTAVIRGCGLESASGISDSTVADLQLDCYRMRIYKGSINKSAMALRSLRLVESGGQLYLKRSVLELLLWLTLVITGLLFIPCFWQFICDIHYCLELSSGLVVGFCLLFSLIGLLGVYPGYDIQAINIDRVNSRLVIEYGIINLRSPRPRKLTLNFNTIAAVQICPVYMDEILSAYELNLVMISSQDRRVNIAGYFKLDTIRSVARRLAQEINCQVLDHSL